MQTESNAMVELELQLILVFVDCLQSHLVGDKIFPRDHLVDIMNFNELAKTWRS